MYCVELAGKPIGKTRLETGDPPMGVVSGLIEFNIDGNPFALLKAHCDECGVTTNDIDVDLDLIDTQNIAALRVFRSDGHEIEGSAGACFYGFRDEGYYVTILGVPYLFYEEEFPHLCEAYDNQFKS